MKIDKKYKDLPEILSDVKETLNSIQLGSVHLGERERENLIGRIRRASDSMKDMRESLSFTKTDFTKLSMADDLEDLTEELTKILAEAGRYGYAEEAEKLGGYIQELQDYSIE